LAWAPLPGAVYARPEQGAAAASTVAVGTTIAAPVVVVPATFKAGQNLVPVSLQQPSGTQFAVLPAQPMAPDPVPDRKLRPATARAFGEIEAEAVRYAGGPCSADIYRIAWAAADLFHIPPAFVAAMIEIESYCNSNAVSIAGARGLMQLIPEAGAREGYRFMYGTDRLPTRAELRDPVTNIQLGAAYLGALEEHFSFIQGDMPRLVLVIAAYNCGPDFLDQRLPPQAAAWDAEQAAHWVKHSAPMETRAYVAAVMDKAALYAAATMGAQNVAAQGGRRLSQ
jgi:soluble lytic murein transglycosylase-like protein